MSRPADPTAKISLLRAAEQVFAEQGLAGAKVEEITRRAGTSKGAFYLHFESKEEAFKQVVESFLARLSAMYQPPSAFPELPTDPKNYLAFWLEQDVAMFELLWQNRSIVGILAGCQGPYTYLLDAFRCGVEKTCREWLQVSRAHGLLRPDLDTDLLSTLMCGAYHELSHKMLAWPRRPPIEDWLRQTVAVFVRGIGTPRLLAAHDAKARRSGQTARTVAVNAKRRGQRLRALRA